MQFDLNDKYRVTTDRYNVILQRKHLTKETPTSVGGKEVWTESYFGSFRALLHHLAAQGIKNSETLTQLTKNHILWASLIDSLPDKVFAAVDAEKKDGKRAEWHKAFIAIAQDKLSPEMYESIKSLAMSD